MRASPAPTANLQSNCITVRQAARIMNVSERSIYMAGQVLRSGRQDLIEKLDRGEISIHAAVCMLKGKDCRPDPYVCLVRAWNRAPEGVRASFLVQACRTAGMELVPR